MLTTYGNWYYPEEAPAAKRRRTTKTDAAKGREQTQQTTTTRTTLSNKPLLGVRNLGGDRLSGPMEPGRNFTQGGGVFTNVGRVANNHYYIQGYSVPDPRFMYGVRDVQNVWPGRVQFPNEPPRYEYRPTMIARPYPLRVQPVYGSIPMQLAHSGWVRASDASAFSPFHHMVPQLQTPIVTTQQVMNTHSSSIQSLNQMVSSVTAPASTSLAEEGPSAKRAFSPTQITTSGSSKPEASMPIAQSITTKPPQTTQPQETPRLQPSHIPVQTIMYSRSSSLTEPSRTVCSDIATDTTSSALDLSTKSAFTTPKITSSGPSTPPTSIVTSQSAMTTQASSMQSQNSKVGSVPASTPTILAELLSGKSDRNTARIISFESSQSQNSKAAIQPIGTTPPSSNQSQESPKLRPSHIPVQTIMYSSSSSLKAANQTSGSGTPTTITATTSSTGELSANSTFTINRTISSNTSKPEASKPIAQPPSLIPLREISNFKPSHIPVQTIVYSPASSRRAVSKSLGSTTNATTAVTTSPNEERSSNSTRIISSGSTVSQTPTVTNQPVMTTHSSSVQSQQSTTFKPTHIPVQTIMYTPSSAVRAARQTAYPATATATATTSFARDHSSNTAYTTTGVLSSGSSKSQAYQSTAQPITATTQSSVQSQQSTTFKPTHIPVQTIMYTPSSAVRAARQTAYPATATATATTSFARDYSPNTAYTTTGVISTESSTAQTSLGASQPVMTTYSSSIQQPSSLARSVMAPSPDSLVIDLTVDRGYTPNQTTSSFEHQTFRPIAEPAPDRWQPRYSPLTPEIITISPPPDVQPEESTSQPHALSPPAYQQQSLGQSQNQIFQLAELLLTSPPANQIVGTAVTPTTATAPAVLTGNSGEGLCKTMIQVDDSVIQSVLNSIKIKIPRVTSYTTRKRNGKRASGATSKKTSKAASKRARNMTSKTANNKANITPAKRMEDGIEEKDALLNRIYTVPSLGGKAVKAPECYEKMLTKQKVCQLYKCMSSDCSFTSNQKTLFDEHIDMHESQDDSIKEAYRLRSENNQAEEGYDWQQCSYCPDAAVKKNLSEHVFTQHGYCMYQCAYCFYRALYQNYVDLHQIIAHRELLKEKPRIIYKCKPLSEMPELDGALKKFGRKRSVKPYVCDQCGSEFLITGDFLDHLLKKHQSVTSYTCHICKTACFKPERLIVHYNLHSYSTFQCAYCLHGTETEKKMFFHLCTSHYTQYACLYMRKWDAGKQVQREDKSKKLRNKSKITNQLECLKMISYNTEILTGHCPVEDVSDDENDDDGRLVIDESRSLNDIIAELGIETETETMDEMSEVASFMQEIASIGRSTAQNVPVSTLLPNASFSLETESGVETYLISFGSSSN